MAVPVLSTATTLLCAHGGQARAVAVSPRVRVAGSPALVAGAPAPVTGCALLPPQGSPCLTGQFLVGATRVRSLGLPVLLQSSASVCPPNPTPLLPTGAQARVRGV
jgi:uncharacterized Zn-binding protein involved in type VI secretion